MKLAGFLFIAAAVAYAQANLTGPNLTGTWAALRAGANGKADPNLAAPAPGPLVLKAPYAAAYEKHRAAVREAEDRGEPLSNGSTACIPYGVPQMMSAIYPLEILQTPGQITIIAEAFSEVRRVYLDQPQAKIGEVPPGYYGHSVGRWNNGTLEVDTIGIKESVPGYRDMPHSDQMRVKEQFTLVSPDILHDQVTVEDPVVLERPWTFTFAYRRTPGYKMLEYVCENNREYTDEHGVTQLKLQDR